MIDIQRELVCFTMVLAVEQSIHQQVWYDSVLVGIVFLLYQLVVRVLLAINILVLQRFNVWIHLQVRLKFFVYK